MTLPQKTFPQLVADMTTFWSNTIGIVPSLQTGDALYAIFQSVSAQLDFLQSQIQLVNNIARAQTSTDGDLDTFYAQFGFYREPATEAEGLATFSTTQPAATQVLISAGTIIQTTGGAIQYQVIADTEQAAWNAAYNAYVLPQGQTSINASVQALVAGANSNVIAGQLNQVASSLPGISNVANGAPIDNGENAQSDTDFRNSFVAYLDSLAKATEAAIFAAANSVMQGLQIALLENTTLNGTTLAGCFSVIIDNGTGSPPSSLINQVYAAVYAVRGFTIQPFVGGPTVVSGNIALVIDIAEGYVASAVNLAVQNAIATAVNMSAIGGYQGEGTFYLSLIEQAALSVTGCNAVKPGATTINGENSDVTLTKVQAVRTTVPQITVTNY